MRNWYLPEDREYRRPRAHRFIFRPRGQRLRWALISFLALVFLVSAANIISYAVDHHRSRQASAALREVYYADAAAEAAATSAPQTAAPVPAAAHSPTATPHVATIQQATVTPPARLEPVYYPGNRYAIASSRFQKLRRQNSDIIGWLTIADLIDEAVVQRDNEFYLDRDYRGYHNVNGAIFLDESCDLRTRPYTLMLYGHNMKTGAMFGGLRNYENLTYYRSNPFITFDTAYEDGRYVIFAVSTISTHTTSRQFVNFSWLCSSTIHYREEALKKLIRLSIYSSGIDVSADDQLLLLVTCVGDEEERRVVVARRIREDETEEGLLRIVRRTTSK